MLSLPFVFLRARPDDLRCESINVGMVVFFEQAPRVYLDAPTSRLRALHPDFDQLDLEKWGSELEAALPQVGDFRTQLLWLQGGLGAISADNDVGHLHGETEEELLSSVESLLERYVHMPERTFTVKRTNAQTSGSTLHAQLRRWFRAAKVYSSKIEDLAKGRIVPGFPIDVADDLYADFALKNGAVHVIETLDLRGVERITKSLRGEAGFTAVLFDQARQRLTTDSRRIAVTAADDYSIVKPIVHLVSRYADDVVALESSSDRQRFADFIGASLNVAPPFLPVMT
jgi:hypothetical protein